MRTCPYCLIEPATIVADNKLVTCHAQCLSAGATSYAHSATPARAELLRIISSRNDGCGRDIAASFRGHCAGDGTVRGFNIGISVGGAAGQIVPHCCVDLIPRRLGDRYSFDQGDVRRHSRQHAVIDRISAQNYSVVGDRVFPLKPRHR